MIVGRVNSINKWEAATYKTWATFENVLTYEKWGYTLLQVVIIIIVQLCTIIQNDEWH